MYLNTADICQHSLYILHIFVTVQNFVMKFINFMYVYKGQQIRFGWKTKVITKISVMDK